MCDYSLGEFKSRLMVEGETLVTARFPGGTLGLIAEADFISFTHTTEWWQAICAVCVPHGTKVEVGPQKARMTFIQTSGNSGVHRDALRNDQTGVATSLQDLARGLTVKILSPVESVEIPAPAAVAGVAWSQTVREHIDRVMAAVSGR